MVKIKSTFDIGKADPLSSYTERPSIFDINTNLIIGDSTLITLEWIKIRSIINLPWLNYLVITLMVVVSPYVQYKRTQQNHNYLFYQLKVVIHELHIVSFCHIANTSKVFAINDLVFHGQ